LTVLNKITKLFLTIVSTFFVALSATAQMEFIENKGQWDNKVNYRGDFTSGSFFLENRGFTVMMHKPEDLQKLSEMMHGHSHNSDGDSISPVASSKIISPKNSGSVIVHSHAYKVDFFGQQ
jgi:hypothetical protein